MKGVQKLDIKSADIARATGAARATVNASIRATRRPAAEHRERLLELVTLVDRLSEVMDDDQIALWLRSRNRDVVARRPTRRGPIPGVLVVFRPKADPPPGVLALPRPKRYDELPPLPTGLRT